MTIKTIKEKLGADMNSALKARDELAVSTIRMLLSVAHNSEIEKKTDLSDAEFLKILSAERKKHLDSIRQFEQGGRSDLVERERRELALIETYLPKQLEDEELRRLVAGAIAETGASQPADFGRVMKAVMQAVGGQADGNRVSAIVKEQLSSKN